MTNPTVLIEGSSIEQMMEALEQAFNLSRKPGYDYDIYKHAGKSQDEVAAAIKQSLPPTPVPSEKVAQMLPNRSVDLANIAWPPLQATINLFRNDLTRIIQQAHGKGVPIETLTETFEDRINGLSLQEHDYMRSEVDAYQEATAHIVRRFTEDMAPHLDELVKKMDKFQPQFIAIIAELLVFSANYTPGNDTTA